MSERVESALQSAAFAGSIEGIAPEDSHALSFALARARDFAVAPISNFRVGALAVGASGSCYLGANMEFIGVPLNASLHAEQSALCNARAHGEQAVRLLIVSELPCGHCRQFLQELWDAPNLEIRVGEHAKTLAALMPNPFAQIRTEGQSLLDSPLQKLKFSEAGPGGSEQSLIEAAAMSYTPYSQSPEGVLLETTTGKRFTGNAIESIAFNPSIPPVIAALNQKNLSFSRKETVNRCLHARLGTSLNHSFALTEAIMGGVDGIPVERFLMECTE